MQDGSIIFNIMLYLQNISIIFNAYSIFFFFYLNRDVHFLKLGFTTKLIRLPIMLVHILIDLILVKILYWILLRETHEVDLGKDRWATSRNGWCSQVTERLKSQPEIKNYYCFYATAFPQEFVSLKSLMCVYQNRF